ncbi:MAG: phosphopantetheine-binding protein, partial [Chroococcales cyanobacterium]
ELISLTAEDIQDWLAGQIAEQLGIEEDEIDITVPLTHYGLSSMQVMSIATLGKEEFGLHISPIAMWNYPNIESLSQYLVTELQASDVEIFEI